MNDTSFTLGKTVTIGSDMDGFDVSSFESALKEIAAKVQSDIYHELFGRPSISNRIDTELPKYRVAPCPAFPEWPVIRHTPYIPIGSGVLLNGVAFIGAGMEQALSPIATIRRFYWPSWATPVIVGAVLVVLTAVL